MLITRTNNREYEKKYEIYHMELNEEKARIYREEWAKKLWYLFYRLEVKMDYDFPDQDPFNGARYNCGLGLDGILDKRLRRIFELMKFHIAERAVEYSDGVTDSIKDYHLHQYYVSKNCYKTADKEGVAQREEFLQRFIAKGLSNYDFKRFDLGGFGRAHEFRCAYIFLNPFDRDRDRDYYYTDNVVQLPIEILAMYFLEERNIKEANYYIDQMASSEDMAKLFAIYDFEKIVEVTDKQVGYIMNAFGVHDDCLQKEALSRRITPYIH